MIFKNRMASLRIPEDTQSSDISSQPSAQHSSQRKGWNWTVSLVSVEVASPDEWPGPDPCWPGAAGPPSPSCCPPTTYYHLPPHQKSWLVSVSQNSVSNHLGLHYLPVISNF